MYKPGQQQDSDLQTVEIVNLAVQDGSIFYFVHNMRFNLQNIQSTLYERRALILSTRPLSTL